MRTAQHADEVGAGRSADAAAKASAAKGEHVIVVAPATPSAEAVGDEMLGSMMLACLELYTRPKGEATTASEHLAELGRHWSFEEPS